MKESNDFQMWFIHDSYTPAGRPKLEAALMAYAKHYFLDCLVYENDLEYLVANILAEQDILWAQNRRLRKVTVKMSRIGIDDKTAWLHIGEQHLVLCKVRGDVLCVDWNPYRTPESVKV